MLFTFLMSFTGKLYWFTRLSSITNTFRTVAIVCGILAVAALIYWFAISITGAEYFDDEEEDKETHLKRALKLIRIFTVLFTFGLLGRVFTPTTSEALVIFGVGESVEYLQNNKNAVQIPDKALQALNKYLDETIGDEKVEKITDDEE